VIPQLILTSVVALAATRHFAARRAERDVMARLPVGPDGIIPGAQSIAIDPPGALTGVLLLHGFGDTPQSLRYLADDLGARGYAVRAPLLPGHGRTIRAFARSRSGEWLGAARAARDALQGRCNDVALVGQSMGGALAVLLAAERPPAALVLLAPYLAPSQGVRRLARWGELATLVAPYVGSRSGALSIHDPEERARSLGYGLTTPRLLAELARLSARADSALGEVRSPALLIQSRDDHRVAAAVAERAMRRLATRHTRLEWVEGCGHVLTVDRERDRVFALVGEWLAQHAPAANGMSDAPATCERTR
jgi:carboxylesterase